jgi:hypothetical protein
VAVQPVERNLAAIFVADIAAYSRHFGRFKACRVIIDGLIATHCGRIFNLYPGRR